MSHAIFQSTTLLHYSSVGQPGSSLAAPVAGGITALIAVLVAVIIIVFILLRYCMRTVDSNRKKHLFWIMCFSDSYQKRSGRKYSLKDGSLSIMRKAHPTDSRGGEGSNGEGKEGKSEEIEMEGPLVHVVAEDNETHEEDGATVEEKDDYFQDPTSTSGKIISMK